VIHTVGDDPFPRFARRHGVVDNIGAGAAPFPRDHRNVGSDESTVGLKHCDSASRETVGSDLPHGQPTSGCFREANDRARLTGRNLWQVLERVERIGNRSTHLAT